jgi:beta-lactamase regulating signal transducer with metallopeptidase domain
MNAWPTISEWCRFGIILALELLIVFAMAKLIVWRLKSAHWRRALWQSALIAMAIIALGELNDVRGLFRSKPLPKELTKPQRAVIVTLKDPDASMTPLETDTIPSMVLPTTTTLPIEQLRAAWPAWIWLTGLALLFCRVLLANLFTLTFRRLRHRVTQADLSERTQSLAETLGIRRPVILAQSERAIAPFTFGVFKPVIVLPKNFADTFTPEQRDVALAHELAHVANFDSLWRALSQCVCALLWWHPATWLAKRELDHASELVADESSLLIADGPNRLAECLVHCASQLQKPALVTWLGMDGGGFRSALGKRVARLMHLKPEAGVARSLPWFVRIVSPATFACLLWLIAALLESPQGNQKGWHGSIIGSALARAAENPPATIAQGRSAQLQTNNTVSIGSIAGLDTSTNTPVVNAEQKAVSDKLKQIRFSEFGPIDNLPLSEVIRSLNEEARRRDPEKKGVNFFLTSKGNRQPGSDEPIDINATGIRLGTTLRNITLEQILRIVIDAADRPIKVSVEDYGILITPHLAESAELHTRFFKVEPSTLAYNLEVIERENGSRQRVTPSDLTSILDALKRHLTKAGVDFQRPGMTIFYNDRSQRLMVRAADDELETVENVVQMINSRPPQLVLTIKAVEVSLSSSNAMWEWFLGGTLKTNTSVGNKPTETTVTGILTEPQFRAVRRDLEKRGGTDLISAPEVTTQSGRQAQIKVMDIRYIVTDLTTNSTAGAKTDSSSVVTPLAEPFELGPVVDVTPIVQADGYSIFLSVQPSLREFLGYEDSGTIAAKVDNGKGEALRMPVPLPKFRHRKTSVSATLWDGQTLVINAGPSRDEQRKRKLDGTFTTNYTDKALFFFVTPTLIDPAGNRMHSDAEVLSKATGRKN